MSSDWEGWLKDAFAILLGKAVTDFDPTATYALFYWDDELENVLFCDVITVEKLLEDLPPLPSKSFDTGEVSLELHRCGLDLARSVFLVNDMDTYDQDFTDTVQELAEERDYELGLYGAELGNAFLTHKIKPRDIDGPQPLVRLRTDGSLWDAMCAATWTMGGPGRLLNNKVKEPPAEGSWRHAFRDIKHDGLIDHLSELCDNDRGECVEYLKKDTLEIMNWLVAQPGWSVVASWASDDEFFTYTIFKIDDAP